MRAKILTLVAFIGLAASVAVVAGARTSANGLPSYTDGWQNWTRINSKPFTRCGPPCAHGGMKNVYVSKRKVGSKYLNGTVVVKTIVRPGTKYVGQYATMRKAAGRWRFVEYQRFSRTARYTVLAQGQLCVDCHVLAKTNDYVFTKR